MSMGSVQPPRTAAEVDLLTSAAHGYRMRPLVKKRSDRAEGQLPWSSTPLVRVYGAAGFLCGIHPEHHRNTGEHILCPLSLVVDKRFNHYTVIALTDQAPALSRRERVTRKRSTPGGPPRRPKRFGSSCLQRLFSLSMGEGAAAPHTPLAQFRFERLKSRCKHDEPKRFGRRGGPPGVLLFRGSRSLRDEAGA